MRRAGFSALGGTAVFASLLAPAGQDPVPAADSEPVFPAVNYAVAVDESASLAPEDMQAEKAAAKRIALGDVSSSSRVTVFGFAAAEKRGQRVVDPVCRPTTLNAAGREEVGKCVDGLRSRKKDEGTGTDLPTAIRQGVNDLTDGTDSSVPRVLFLLTDGKMDVEDSFKYGEKSHRVAEGEQQLKEALKEAAAQNVQIWPLGFGSDPDKKQLDQIAAGGYRKGCVELPSATPRAHKVDGANDVGSTLEKIFAAAHCLRHEEGPSKRPPATLEIGISPLATVGSIVVDKGDPKVKITYLDPKGDEIPTTSGSFKGSRFELAGGSGTVEALKIVDPLPGVWKVKAEAPEGHRSLPVAVSVLWQGELNGAITMDPPSPQAGEKVTVTMRLQTREGYEIKDPRDYEGLRVRSELTGDGFSPQALDLADDGKGADSDASDGDFTGTVTIPQDADGALTVSATLTASGLSADTRSETGKVALGELPVKAVLELPEGDVHPGGSVTGTLDVSNTTDTAHTLRLSVADVQDRRLSVEPTEITLKPGAEDTRKVTVRVAPASAFGDRLGNGVDVSGTLTVVDTTDGDRALERAPVSVHVTPKPGILKQYWWAFVAGAVVLVLAVAAVVALLGLRRRRRDPFGLVLQLVDEDGTILNEHKAGHGNNKQWYEFAVAEAHRSPRIDKRAHGPYAVRRSREGGAVVRKGGSRFPLTARGGRVQLTDALSLSLGGTQPPGPRPSEGAYAGGTGPGTPGRGGTGTYDDLL
ncbi:VWA domain-containing protein [Streptomyces sp. HD]|uniref:VWA domain-containing protein n=1 Tax=Streptomyces sp. HD TaxID=3020892 RepID=UPI0023301FC1|nr:VWA domain-containing protein [Streptomyces sp. HD]MDC0772391.1 VWA domain-containing protein [Streptomyces sp. HD]